MNVCQRTCEHIVTILSVHERAKVSVLTLWHAFRIGRECLALASELSFWLQTIVITIKNIES